MRMTDRLFAALMLLTRLPFGRLRRVPSEAFAHTTDWWSAVGWLTGGATALVLWGAAAWLPMPVAVVLAFGARVLLTGALHEDGLADFFDGFGGGTTREKTLAIMKDSHIGTYGVLGLIFYALLLTGSVAALPVDTAVRLIAVGDPLSKFAASQLIDVLPYVRPLAQSKVGTAYRRMSIGMWLFSAAFGLLPAVVWLPAAFWSIVIVPFVVTGLLIGFMRRRIGGYTGDCCGATFLLSEAAFYLAAVVVSHGSLVG